jgi:uncharacterized coiled-coil protein SlyX
MAFPILPIISAVTSLGIAAMDLFSKRKTVVRETRASPMGDVGMKQLADSLAKRMDELESSDVEQARLISELSNNVQKLAEALQIAADAEAKRRIKQSRLIIVIFAVALAGLSVSVWNLTGR